MNLLQKMLASLEQEGFTRTLGNITEYGAFLLKQRSFRKHILGRENIEDRFTEIFRRNYWGSKESASGPGSTLEYTANLRAALPEMFGRFSIRSLFDAPCGDFHWMQEVLKKNHLEYTGGDIVAPLINAHNTQHKNAHTKFMHIDLTKEKFPAADLMLCRACLFHLSFEDTRRLLQNFIASDIPYLLTTTHVNTTQFHNKDIATGDFRLIDLFSAPYHFPQDVLFRVEDWKAPEPQQEMCLWNKTQVAAALEQFNRELASMEARTNAATT